MLSPVCHHLEELLQFDGSTLILTNIKKMPCHPHTCSNTTVYMYLSTVYPFQIYPVSDGNIGNIPLPFILSYFICIFFIIIVLSSKVYPFYNLKNGEYIFHS